MEIKDASLEQIKEELGRRLELEKQADDKARKEAEAKAAQENDLSNRMKAATEFINVMLKCINAQFTGPNDAGIISRTRSSLVEYLNKVYLPERIPGYIAVECKATRTLVDNDGVVIDDATNDAGVVIIAKALYEAKKQKILPTPNKKKSLVTKEQLKELQNQALPAKKIKTNTNKPHKR